MYLRNIATFKKILVLVLFTAFASFVHAEMPAADSTSADSAAIGASGFLMGGIVSPLVGMGDIATSVSIVLVVGAVLTLVSVLASGSLCAKGIVSHSK